MPRIAKSARAASNPPTTNAAVLVDPVETTFGPPAQLTTFERPAAPPAFLQGEGAAFVPPRTLPIVPADILDRFHAKEPFDTRFSSCARLLQSIWRDRRGLPIGEITPKDGPRRRSGSRLTPAVAQRGFNFLTRDIAKLVRREAAYREYGAMFDEERLWGNLLSSQPLVFNLFGQAKLDPAFGTRLFRALLPDFAAELQTIHFETSPGRGDERFTGDRTAFDLVAVVTTPRRTPGSFWAALFLEAVQEARLCPPSFCIKRMASSLRSAASRAALPCASRMMILAALSRSAMSRRSSSVVTVSKASNRIATAFESKFPPSNMRRIGMIRLRNEAPRSSAIVARPRSSASSVARAAT